jgi:putative ABC transport system substrate-binding protein
MAARVLIGPPPVLAVYGFEGLEQFQAAATYVDRILRGATPAELPLQLPTRYQLVVNLKAARAIGLPIPDSFLARAVEVME